MYVGKILLFPAQSFSAFWLLTLLGNVLLFIMNLHQELKEPT